MWCPDLGVIRAVCGPDEYCYMELWSFVESLNEIDKKLGEVRIEGALGASAPIVVSTPEATIVEMSDKLYDTLRGLGYEIDRESVDRGARGLATPEDQASSFASFVFKRLLYKTAKEAGHQLLSGEWSETFCPVCGLVPVASIEERVSETSRRVRYKCLCGNSWYTSSFVCPACKASKPDDFHVHRVGKLSAYICKSCGHIVLVAGSEHVESQTDEEILPIIAALAINAIISSREEYEGDHDSHLEELDN